MHPTCPFCDFEDRAAVVYQDDLCFVVISRQPISPFHTLVIPRQHFERFTALPDDVASHVFLVAKRISEAIGRLSEADFITHWSDDDLKQSGVNLVAHYKFHIIPRFRDDKVVIAWNREEDVENARQRDCAQKLRAELSST